MHHLLPASLIGLFLCGVSGFEHLSKPTKTDALIENVPTIFDLSDLHLVKAEHAFDSYWTGGIIRTTSNDNYLLVAHAAVYGNVTTYRGGILSLDDPLGYHPKYYQAVDTFTHNNGTVEPFHLTVPGNVFDMEFIGPANEWFPRLKVTSRVPETKFNIAIDMDKAGPPVLNAGLGSWRWVGEPQHQVSVPRGRLSGTFTVNDTLFTIDPSQSLAWYDRQWGPTLVPAFTWFGLHLTSSNAPHEEIYASIWNWEDDVNGNKSFATVQRPSGINSIVPLAEFTATDSFHSPASNKTYSLDHRIRLADGTLLHIKPVRRDQEFVLQGFDNPFYSGAVEVTGNKYTGYGYIDILPGGGSF
ncbi:hypothetical protein BDW59DRAFT_144906 [Aspergillus cavernicola]|uniref:AttH domain-containing protein n=1 Tax=Aspergillus cavernicola TaxID=176166 RepID=A0ABR4IGN6_9EURO